MFNFAGYAHARKWWLSLSSEVYHSCCTGLVRRIARQNALGAASFRGSRSCGTTATSAASRVYPIGRFQLNGVQKQCPTNRCRRRRRRRGFILL